MKNVNRNFKNDLRNTASSKTHSGNRPFFVAMVVLLCIVALGATLLASTLLFNVQMGGGNHNAEFLALIQTFEYRPIKCMRIIRTGHLHLMEKR